MHEDNEQRKRRCALAMRTHGDAVYRLAFARTRSKHDAEDIFQTTFLRYFAANRTFNNAEHEKAWLLRVCINACLDLQRSAWRRRVDAMPDGFDVADPASTPDKTPQEDALNAAMTQLSPEQRTAVHLHYFEGYSTGEIAQTLGLRPATVRSHLRRARIALKAALDDARQQERPQGKAATAAARTELGKAEPIREKRSAAARPPSDSAPFTPTHSPSQGGLQ